MSLNCDIGRSGHSNAAALATATPLSSRIIHLYTNTLCPQCSHVFPSYLFFCSCLSAFRPARFTNLNLNSVTIIGVYCIITPLFNTFACSGPHTLRFLLRVPRLLAAVGRCVPPYHLGSKRVFTVLAHPLCPLPRSPRLTLNRRCMQCSITIASSHYWSLSPVAVSCLVPVFMCHLDARAQVQSHCTRSYAPLQHNPSNRSKARNVSAHGDIAIAGCTY